MAVLATISSPVDGVELLTADLDSVECDFSELRQWLSDDERGRALRIRSDHGRRRYIVSHGLLREIIGRRLQLPPRALQFTCGENGKPVVAASLAASSLHFNMSHSENLLLIGLSCRQRIGVDIECVRPDVAWCKLAERFYGRDEMAQLKNLSAELAPAAFFRIWTAKEAYLKATGQGITVPLPSIEIELLEDGRHAKLLRIAGEDAALSCWAIHAVEARPGFVATIAWESSALAAT